MSNRTRQRATLVRCGKIIGFSAAVLSATTLTLECATVTGVSTAAFSFLVIVLLSAYFGDLLVAIATSLVAALCFDYFYLPPVGTFNVSAFPDWISLATFLLASVIISHLTAAAADSASHRRMLNKALAQLKNLGEWLLGTPRDQLTLSGTAKETLRLFSLEYCSIHVYGEGRWQHFTGAASSDIPQEIETRLRRLKDHSTDVMELADESLLGVRYVPINKGTTRLGVLAVKGGALPNEVLGPIAYMIGIQLDMMSNS